MTKIKATLIHFAISVGLLSAVVAYFVTQYTLEYMLLGATQGLLIVACVDLIIGPVLTAVVYKPHKKGMLFDLCVIASFQLVALGYGVHAVWTQVPCVQVMSADGLHLLTRADVVDRHLKVGDKTLDCKNGMSKFHLDLPSDGQQIAMLSIAEGFVSGGGLEYRSDLYLPVGDKKDYMNQFKMIDEQCFEVPIKTPFGVPMGCYNPANGNVKIYE